MSITQITGDDGTTTISGVVNNTADITVITEICKEKNIRCAISQFENSEYINKVNSMIRVQNA